MFSSMFSGSHVPEVMPGDYYDYDFIHETNDTDFLGRLHLRGLNLTIYRSVLVLCRG